MSSLWYEQPAVIWEEALPIGNGRIGAMVYGKKLNEQLQVNEESMWYGHKMNRLNPDFKANLPKIRELLDQGQIYQAECLMNEAMAGCPESVHPYQTLGDLFFFFRGIEEKEITDYRRELDLSTAVTSVSFRAKDTLYKREIFASKPADCIVMRFCAEGSGTVDFSVRLRRSNIFDGIRKIGNDGVELFGNLGRGGCEYAMALRAEALTEGTVSVVGEHLRVDRAKEVVLYFTADTTNQYYEDDKKRRMDAYVEEFLKKKTFSTETALAVAEMSYGEKQEYLYQSALQNFLTERIAARFEAVKGKTYQTLLEEHLADYTSFYNRFEFQLEGIEEFDKKATDVRLREASEGNTDAGLSKILFDFGRYLTISSSRKGDLPANLQGIWNKDYFPAWDSKYTININAEMNYWHVESCNLSECHYPLFELLKRVQRNGRKTAREMYGCRGFVAHHNTDMHGDTAPQDIWFSSSYWTQGAAWLSTHLWMHYQYTKDMEFLKEAFPIMMEAALFFVDFLIERNGYLVTSPTVSPENIYILPNGEQGACCVGATMDNQILRHLFGGCLDAWKELGEKCPDGCSIPDVEDIEELVKEIENCKNRLNPTRISDSGRIMEWQEDYKEAEPGHRHISHLYGLYPAGEITVDGTPELAAAARKTLEYRLAGGGGHTGWSRAWIMNHYASLWDGEAVYENIEKMLGMSTYPNMFDRHPPFQIDGNFGACAAMSGMLVQSNAERIILLPALPKAWPSGSVKGLRLVGNAQIDMSWKGCKLEKAVIKADSDLNTVVICGEKRISVQIKAGETFAI